MVVISNETFDLDWMAGPFYKVFFTIPGAVDETHHIDLLERDEIEHRFYHALDKAIPKVKLNSHLVDDDDFIKIFFFVLDYSRDEGEYRVYLFIASKYQKFLDEIADKICDLVPEETLILQGPYKGWMYSCKEDIREFLKDDKTQEIKRLNIEVDYWKEAYESLKKKCLGFNSIIEDVENEARWHKESQENQLKNELNEIKEDI